MLHFIVVRMRLAVWRQQSVDAEGVEVGLVAVVAAIGEEFHSVLLLDKSLVHPVPDGGAGDAGVGIDHIPVFLQVAHGVAHGMGILACYQRFLCFLLGLSLQHFRSGIAEVVEGRVVGMAVIEG